ncbi:hypothetical protein PHYSODRAFT_413397, partial [Phytophthora sojae]
VNSEHELVQALAAYAGHVVKIFAVYPHPKLSRLVCVRAGRARKKLRRRHYKDAARTAPRRRGARGTTNRQATWVSDSEEIGRALQTYSWADIRKIVGVSPWGEQLLFRIKQRAFSRYDPVNRCPGCPMEEC